MVELNRNVGTEGYPVSALHEYAVGLIFDRLKRDPKEVTSGESDVRLTMVNGEMSVNLLEGVERVTIPNTLSAIGGFVPDIALFNQDNDPIRVIEVVTTSEPTEKKREFFKAHDISIIEVPCRTASDLYGLVRQVEPIHPGEGRTTDGYIVRPNEWQPWAYRRDIREGGVNYRPERNPAHIQHDADSRIVALLNDLAYSTPHIRREFLRVIRDELPTIESQLPLRRDNPKWGILFPSP